MDQQALLQATSLVRGRLLDRRNNIKKEIIRYTLSLDRCPEEFSSHRLVVLADESCGIDIDAANVASILDELSDEGVVSYKNNSKYCIDNRPKFATIDDMIEPVWTEFSSILKSNKNDLELEYLNKNMRSAFEDFFVDFFSEISESSEELLEHEIDTIHHTDTKSRIEKIASDANLRDQNSFVQSMSYYLQNPGEELTEFVGNIYSGLVNIDLLSKEEYIDFSSIDVSGKKLLIDTNVIVALLCESDKLHPLVSAVCNRSSDLGFEIRYTKATKDELRGLIKGSENEMSGLSVDSKSTDVESTQFVKDFRRGGEDRWNDYIAEKKNWSKYIQLQWGVEEIEETAPFDPEVFKFSKDTIRQLSEYPDKNVNRSDNSIDHDGRVLTTITGMRKNVTASLSVGPYVLSFDNLLASVSEIGAEEYWDERVVIQPRKWLNYLLAFTPSDMSNSEKRETSLALIQSTTNFEDTLSVEEYAELIVPKIHLKSEDKDILAEYLVDHPKARELQKALDRDQGTEAEQVAREMLSDESRLEMFSKERNMEEKLKNVSSDLQKERERKKKERQRRKAAEARVESSQSSDNLTININTSAVSNAEASSEISQFNGQLNNFIGLLDGTLPAGIEQSELPNPPEDETDMEAIKQWLSEVSAGLATEGIAAHANSLQPVAEQLLEQIPNLM